MSQSQRTQHLRWFLSHLSTHSLGSFGKLTLVLFVVLFSNCGGSASTTVAPSAPTPPPPANIAGNWSGTMEASNYQPLAVSMVLSQSGSTVTGTWSAITGTSRIAGNVTGTTDSYSFTGTLSFSINQTAGCSGSFSGGASSGASTLTWSGAGFTGNCGLTAGNPTSPRFVLQRR